MYNSYGKIQWFRIKYKLSVQCSTAMVINRCFPLFHHNASVKNKLGTCCYSRPPTWLILKRRVSERVRFFEWMSEWVHAWLCKCVNVWMSKCMNEQMSKWSNEQMRECVSAWVREWVSAWVRECVSAWVREWVREWRSDRTKPNPVVLLDKHGNGGLGIRFRD